MIHGNEMVKVILALWEELPSLVSSTWQHGKSKEVMDSTKAGGGGAFLKFCTKSGKYINASSYHLFQKYWLDICHVPEPVNS